ncbi:glycerophosphodiester phosphodiesterase family protein [Microbacterium sp. No. 7]|uniref:glycerophosphodiester phosphodiesterase family protein n=1 Tax=Microbacterium sp. No. 7 TaxID=1714373 RepID=UPI0006D1F620|nr:glycerophosphodiester phosphodiesterase family protein [Microbacterium sp. No. 7]ALJ20221.1 glycerophosphodiester phosphodiesterase [Microbacterium sp. No. 7]
MTHPWFGGVTAPRALAHRGFVPADAEDVSENSLAAVAAAHAVGARYVESDCHLTADGAVVLFHDDTLTRVTGDARPIADVTHAELEQLMATRGGLLSLEQALDTFPTLRFNLDVKAAAAAEPAGRIVARHADRVLLTSFSDARRQAAVAACRAAGGDPATSAGRATIARLLAAVGVRSRALVRRVLSGIDAVQLPPRQRGLPIVTPRLIDAVHDAGVEVHVWTINDADEMRRLLDHGVDGLVTDRVDVALRTIGTVG